jgi:PAS domain S-box-containing protein
LINRVIPWPIRWKGELVEALVFLAVYLIYLAVRPLQAPDRSLVGSVAVLVPLASAVILIFRSLPAIPAYSKSSWLYLGVALAFWTAGGFIRMFYEAILGVRLPVASVADLFYFLAYPFLFCALIIIPFENRYAPSRFRFLLDATISSGAIATLGWLILTRSVSVASQGGPSGTIPSIYPIADMILVIILVNVLLANRKVRRMSTLWAASMLAVLVSDSIYSALTTFQSYQPGSLGSLGWTIGYLLFGLGAVLEAGFPGERSGAKSSAADRWARLQNLLPFSLVLVLFVFVLLDWQMRGQISVLGLIMSLLLSVGLIVRMGVRAGEAELQRYWQLFSSLADPTFICDKRGRLLLGNPALVNALGMEQESQVIGKPLEAIFEGGMLLSDMLAKAETQDLTQEVILRLHRTPYLLSLSPIAGEGRRMLIAGVTQDLSEQKRQQEAIEKAYEQLQGVYRQLEDLNSQLEQKVEERTRNLSEAYLQLEEQNKILQALDQLKSDFVSMVSHELRTPLTSLTGGLELLLKGKRWASNDRTNLLLMKNEIQRLTRFVENILDLSAMEAGRISLQQGPLLRLPHCQAEAPYHQAFFLR